MGIEQEASKKSEDVHSSKGSETPMHRTKEFQPGLGPVGLRCDNALCITDILPETQADSLGLMKGWYLVEVNEIGVPLGGAADAISRAKHTGKPYTMKFEIPPALQDF